MIPVEDYKWFGMPGHFIAARNCRFHLCTQVGTWLVSTVGMYYPPSGSVEAPTKIGSNRYLETMVFRAGEVCREAGCNCGMPDIGHARDLDSDGYDFPSEAQAGHMAMCRKWAEKQ